MLDISPSNLILLELMALKHYVKNTNKLKMAVFWDVAAPSSKR
jgi:hypothetical protein